MADHRKLELYKYSTIQTSDIANASAMEGSEVFFFFKRLNHKDCDAIHGFQIWRPLNSSSTTLRRLREKSNFSSRKEKASQCDSCMLADEDSSRVLLSPPPLHHTPAPRHPVFGVFG
jgi:hypothetical protein